MNGLRRDELLRMSIEELGELIDTLDRPYEENDRLRACFHAARRDPGAKVELAEAIERSMGGLSTGELRAITEKHARKPRPSVDVTELVARFMADVATEVVAHLLRAPAPKHNWRRHRRGR